MEREREKEERERERERERLDRQGRMELNTFVILLTVGKRLRELIQKQYHASSIDIIICFAMDNLIKITKLRYVAIREQSVSRNTLPIMDFIA